MRNARSHETAGWQEKGSAAQERSARDSWIYVSIFDLGNGRGAEKGRGGL